MKHTTRILKERATKLENLLNNVYDPVGNYEGGRKLVVKCRCND